MTAFRLIAAGLAAATLAAPAAAQINNQDPARFVQGIATTGLSSLKGDKAGARGRFKALLSQHFAVNAMGDQLIRRWRPKISDAQYKAYSAALPGFLVGTYADRLYNYADANVKVVRVQNQGSNAAVLTQISKSGAKPVNVIWMLVKTGNGYKVSNLNVGGVNVAMAQRADFDSYVQRNGFDALVNFMQRRG